MKILKALVYLILVSVLALAAWLYIAPPDIIRVGANYTAKIVCSNVHLAGRDPQDVLKVDVQAPGHPILTLMRVAVDGNEVTAGMFGLFGEGRAVHRPGFGCTSEPAGTKPLDLPKLAKVPSKNTESEWPLGDRVEINANPKLQKVLDDPTLQGPDMRAILVVKDGLIVAERYGEGFSVESPLLGWSMAKTVTAGVIGALEKQGKIKRDAQGLLPHWSDDNRKNITLESMMGMASSLKWNEGYGTVSDVTRMLFLSPDMAAFASKAPLEPESGTNIGKVFNYSSGTSVMISRVWQNLFSDPQEALRFPHQALFAPLGMSSAVMETDATGTLIGGSYVYATARDWARYGQFLLQKGVWNGNAIVPEGYVDWMVEPHPAKGLDPKEEDEPKHIDGSYGRGHIWLRPPGQGRGGVDPEFNHKAWWLSGHDGQSIAILPEENLVVVRLGLTPSKLQYKAATLTNAVVEALK